MATTNFIDHLLEGDHASRPAATAVPEGTLYACSTHGLIYQSDAATWATWATLGGGTPAAHAASHEDGGADEIDVTGLVGAGGASTFHGVHAKKTASFPSLTTATLTTLAFDGTDTYDTDAIHDPVTNNTRLTVPAGLGGYWVPWAKVGFATNSTGARRVGAMKNGVLYNLDTVLASTGVSTQRMVTFPPILLVATDFIEFQAAQHSGGALSTDEQECGMYLQGT